MTDYRWKAYLLYIARPDWISVLRQQKKLRWPSSLKFRPRGWGEEEGFCATGLNRSTNGGGRHFATNCDNYSGGGRVAAAGAAETPAVGVRRTTPSSRSENGRR